MLPRAGRASSNESRSEVAVLHAKDTEQTATLGADRHYDLHGTATRDVHAAGAPDRRHHGEGRGVAQGIGFRDPNDSVLHPSKWAGISPPIVVSNWSARNASFSGASRASHVAHGRRSGRESADRALIKAYLVDARSTVVDAHVHSRKWPWRPKCKSIWAWRATRVVRSRVDARYVLDASSWRSVAQLVQMVALTESLVTVTRRMARALE